jgi:hypothetical protein
MTGMGLPPINLWTYRMVLSMILRLDIKQLAGMSMANSEIPNNRYGCWTEGPKPHPWHGNIIDMACGYDHRMTEHRCAGCWRQRVEAPIDQIPDGRGYVNEEKTSGPNHRV